MTLTRFNSREILDADDEIADSDAVPTNGFANTDREHRRQEEEFGINLPHSTHSLLFTEPVSSPPFWFAVSIASLSFFVMILALINNTRGSTEINVYGVPVNVSPAVKASQYFALLVTAEINYKKFVVSSIVRILLGYTFLVNAFYVIAQGDRVLDIFYDMLALSFVEMLDDISFHLATMDVFGKRLKRATTKACFREEFPHQSLGRGRGLSIVLKTVYFFNLLVFFTLLSALTVRQEQGYFNCKSITVTFGNDIWEEAVVTTMKDNETMLVYSFFNGVYQQKGTQDGRPVYIEQNKFDNTPYHDKVPAEIKYCKKLQAWVFTHKDIRKSTSDESECQWLLKANSVEYDLLNVPSDSWSVWVGKINHAEVSITCNTCYEDADCNLNGVCNGGMCECDESDDSVNFFGKHCEHKLKDQCNRIKGNDNETWSVVRLNDQTLFTTYSRPLYSWNGSSFDKYNLTEDDSFYMIFSGAHWLVIYFKGQRNLSLEFWEYSAAEYHPFWSNDLTHNEVNNTVFISEPTSASTPVGVDFYEIGEQGEQYGPFGVLYPMQNPPGRGYFQCIGF